MEMTIETFQTIVMAINLLLLTPIWWTLARIYTKLDSHDAELKLLIGKIAYIEGRDDKLLQGP